MRGCDAVKQRILKLLKERNLSINKVCMLGNLTTSTLNTMLNDKSEYCSVRTLQKVCQGLNITLYDFFNDDIFKDLETEE